MQRNSIRWAFRYLVVLPLAAIGSVGVLANTTPLVPDMYSTFECAHELDQPAIEDFLVQNGFRALNKVRAQLEHGIAPLERLWIEGLDEEQRIVRFSGSPFASSEYTVALYTTPPTSRVTELEEAIVAFVSDKLACHVKKTVRDENSAEAGAIHASEVQRLEAWFEQLEELE